MPKVLRSQPSRPAKAKGRLVGFKTIQLLDDYESLLAQRLRVLLPSLSEENKVSTDFLDFILLQIDYNIFFSSLYRANSDEKFDVEKGIFISGMYFPRVKLYLYNNICSA